MKSEPNEVKEEIKKAPEVSSKITEIAKPNDDVVDENDLIIKLSKTYKFEDDTYDTVDLRPLDGLTARDLIDANKILMFSGNATVIPETNLEYDLIIASKATRIPIEFFKGLSPRDALKIKTRVTNFFYGTD